MTDAHQLSRQDARRIMLQAQLLTAERPVGMLEVVRHLTLLQVEPTAPIAPTADLVLWSRLGPSYDPQELRDAVERQLLIEHRSFLRVPEYFALLRAEMAAWPGVGELREWQVDNRDWVEANDDCRQDILARLEDYGPQSVRDLPDTIALPWQSSGWTNDRNVRRLLDFLVSRGEVAAAGRRGRELLWDLAERVYPDDPVVPLDEAAATRDQLRLRALGLARARTAELPGEPHAVGRAGEPAVVEGVRGEWRVEPSLLDLPFEGRTALLSPFDRLVQDRKRLTEIFEFDYQLEMYKPAAKRRWGYYALPILHGDRLVGKLDAVADREEGALVVNAVHEDVPFTKAVARDVDREIASLAAWLDLDVERAA